MLSADIWSVEERLGVVLYGKSQITKILKFAFLGPGAVSQGQWFTAFRMIVVAACSKTHIPFKMTIELYGASGYTVSDSIKSEGESYGEV
jgi:hypothetical protein